MFSKSIFTSIKYPWLGPDWNRISLPFEPTDSKLRNAKNNNINLIPEDKLDFYVY